MGAPGLLFLFHLAYSETGTCPSVDPVWPVREAAAVALRVRGEVSSVLKPGKTFIPGNDTAFYSLPRHHEPPKIAESTHNIWEISCTLGSGAREMTKAL